MTEAANAIGVGGKQVRALVANTFRLSRNVRVHAFEPIMYESGRLYFRLGFKYGAVAYVSVPSRGTSRAAHYWLHHLIHNTHAVEAECLREVLMFGFGVAYGKLVFCSIECARHAGVEPSRMMFAHEYKGDCDGCAVPLEKLDEQEAY